MDVLGLGAGDEFADVAFHVDHHEIGAMAGPERVQRLVDTHRVSNLGASAHGNLRGGAHLPTEGSDDE